MQKRSDVPYGHTWMLLLGEGSEATEPYGKYADLFKYISVNWSIWSTHLVDTFVAHVTDAILSPKWLVTKCPWPGCMAEVLERLSSVLWHSTRRSSKWRVTIAAVILHLVVFRKTGFKVVRFFNWAASLTFRSFSINASFFLLHAFVLGVIIRQGKCKTVRYLSYQGYIELRGDAFIHLTVVTYKYHNIIDRFHVNCTRTDLYAHQIPEKLHQAEARKIGEQ